MPHDSKVAAEASAVAQDKVSVPLKYDSDGMRHVLARVGIFTVIVSFGT
jgi:hypothetical protein